MYHAIGLARPPIPSSAELEKRRPDRNPHNARIYQHGDDQREAKNLDQDEVAKHEGSKNCDHDRGGTRNHSTGSRESFNDCIVVTHARAPRFGDARDQKNFVVHAESEHDAENEQRNGGEGAAQWLGEAQQLASETVLKDEDHRSKRDSDRKEI